MSLVTTEFREPLNEIYSLDDMIKVMAEGNIGALSILQQMVGVIALDKIQELLLVLDDMNVRGSALYVGFVDACNREWWPLFNLVNPESDRVGFVTKINRVVSMGGTNRWIACLGGARKFPNRLRFPEEYFTQMSDRQRAELKAYFDGTASPETVNKELEVDENPD